MFVRVDLFFIYLFIFGYMCAQIKNDKKFKVVVYFDIHRTKKDNTIEKV